jgi:hypothetical protein
VGAKLLALLASAVVILSAAYIGDIRAAIQGAFPNHYRFVVGGVVVLAIAATVSAAATHIREQRLWRYGVLASALAGAALYFGAFRTGNADVDAVEAFHFVQYGVLAFLFYRAWRGHGDARRVAYPLLAGLTVGVLDESLQWFLASRVGELHDVMLDLAAVTSGLLVGIAWDPPSKSVVALSRPAAQHVAVVATVVVILFAAFLNAAHVGYEIADPEIGVFRSRYSETGLKQMAAERARTWREGLPVATGRFAREDHYLTEALWHVRERNEAVAVGDMLTGWREHRILEKYYAPLLELPAVNAEYRWPSEQRALTRDAAARVHGAPYVSRAHALPIYALKIRPGLIFTKTEIRPGLN